MSLKDLVGMVRAMKGAIDGERSPVESNWSEGWRKKLLAERATWHETHKTGLKHGASG
jgi:hypothetical protein